MATTRNDDLLEFTISRRTIAAMLAIIILLVVGGATMIDTLTASNQDNGVTHVDIERFDALTADPDMFVLQVHTPYYGEIPGTDLVREDWDAVDDYINALPSDRDAPIAVYCRSGRMSRIVATELVARGYTNVYELDGGMNAWQSSGRRLITR